MKRSNGKSRRDDRVGSTKIRRYIIRELVGGECLDWAADRFADGTGTARPGFPFRLIRRWFTSEASATLERSAAESKITLKQAAFDWAEKQTVELGGNDGGDAEIIYLDELSFALRSRTWRRHSSARDLWSTYQRLSDPAWRMQNGSASESLEIGTTSYLSLKAHPGRGSCLPIRSFDYDEAYFAPYPHLLADLCKLIGHPRGYWNVQHALLTTEDLIATLTIDPLAAKTARALAAATQHTTAPICHTLLVRPPEEWVLPLSLRKSSLATLAEGVRSLCLAMLQAGVRPLSAQPPAVVSAQTPLHTVSRLAGSAFIDPFKVELLHGSGVNTIADLCSLPARELPDRFPVMPSDLIAISETFTALGHRHTYANDEIVPLT